MSDLENLARESLRQTHLLSQDRDTEFLTLDELKCKINSNESFKDSQERARLVDQAIVMLHGNYVFTHTHAINRSFDPVAALLQLRSQLINSDTGSNGTNNWDFFKYVTQVIAKIGDPHTAVHLPDEVSSYTGFLPFLIEGYFDRDAGRNRYYISHVIEGAEVGNVAVGDEVLALNGESTDQRLATIVSSVNGVFAPGLRFERRYLDQLTIIPLDVSLVVDESAQSLTLTLGRDGKTIEHEHVYLFSKLGLERSRGEEEIEAANRRFFGDVRSELFAPRSAASRAPTKSEKLTREELDHQPHLRIERISLNDGEHSKKRICYIRLYALTSGNREKFVNDVIAPIEARRSEFDGVIIDVRSCRGGSIRIADQLTARCAGRAIERVKGQFRNTRLNEAYCRQRAKKIEMYGAWADSIRTRGAEGLLYSAALPFGEKALLEPPASAAGNGDIPKLMIIDQYTASAAEVFAAGFADHGLGEVLGVQPTTAGACSHGVRLNKLLMERVNDGNYPYDRESAIGRLKLSLCRLVRSGRSAGEIIEGKGVRADVIVPLTKNDVMGDNQDLLATAITRLMNTPKR